MNPKLDRAFLLLEDARQQLLRVCDACPTSQRLYKPSAEEWSMIQVVNHLSTTEQGILSYVQQKMAKPAPLLTAGIRAWIRSSIVQFALRYKKRIKAPSVVTIPVDHLSYDQVKQTWMEGRQQWHQFLEQFPPELLDKEIFRHPLVGMITMGQTLAFMREHVLHHVAQIKRLAEASRLAQVS